MLSPTELSLADYTSIYRMWRSDAVLTNPRGMGEVLYSKLMYFVYIMRCKDGSLYTGITTNVERRFAEHKDGVGGHYTSARGVVRVVHTEQYPNRSSASKRESEIKGWRREKKLALIHLYMLKREK